MKNREDIHKRIYLICTIAIVITLPFSLKLCSWSIGFLTLNWLIEGNFKKKLSIIKDNVLLQLIVLFALVHLVSLAYSANLKHGLFVIEIKLAIFILPIVIGTMPRLTPKQLSILLGSFVLSCTLAVMASLTWAIINQPSLESIYTNFDQITANKYNSLFMNKSNNWHLFSYVGLSRSVNLHPTYFSMYLVFCLSLITLFVKKRVMVMTMIHKSLLVLLITLLFVAIILLSSRIAIIALILLTGFYVIQYYFHRKNYLSGLFMCFSALIVFLLIIYQNPVTYYRLIKEPMMMENNFSDNPDWNSVSLRLLEWRASLNIISRNPIIGVGIGDTREELNSEYDKMADLKQFKINLNSHNQYFQTSVSLGIVGLVVLIGILCYPAWRAFQNKDLTYLTFIFIVATFFLTESILEVQKGVAFFSFFHSLLYFHPTTIFNTASDV